MIWPGKPKPQSLLGGMMSLFLIGIFIGVLNADEVKISSPIVNYTDVNYTESRMLRFGDNKQKEILLIDKDGDIFLRGKWIGHDVRLKEILKSKLSTSKSKK